MVDSKEIFKFDLLLLKNCWIIPLTVSNGLFNIIHYAFGKQLLVRLRNSTKQCVRKVWLFLLFIFLIIGKLTLGLSPLNNVFQSVVLKGLSFLSDNKHSVKNNSDFI